ncbi:MAG: hypothetical protein ACRD98_02600 [Nitrososphaera sp.]
MTAILITGMLFAAPTQQNGYYAVAQVQVDPTGEDLLINLSLAPSIVEVGQASHNIGYLQITSNSTGGPILAPRDLEVELTSRSPAIASVPARVVIEKGTDYAQFNLDVTDVTGESDISALFGNQIVTKTFKVVEAGSQIPNDITLVINLPSNKMQIGSEMPISVYLENNGEIMQAPEDVSVSFDYERSLLRLSSVNAVIKKGDYYAVVTVTSLERSGNAFIRASTASPVLDAVSTVEISQTQPATLRLHVFPEKVGQSEKTVDVFVGLHDASGNPTVASNDIKIEMFASSSGVQNIGSYNPVIKKGEFGYHLRPTLAFFANQTVTIGATTAGLGVSTDEFEVVADPLSSGSPKASDKLLKVYTIPTGMPSDATAIVVYQLNAIEHDSDDGTDTDGDGEVDSKDAHAIDALEEGELYPIQSGVLYSPGQGNLNVVTSDFTNLRITETGWIIAGSSYGAAVVTAGNQPGTFQVSVSLANTASNSNSLTVTGSLTPVKTKIYSPAGLHTDSNYRVPFNQEGTADLFFLTLDSSGRPSRAETGVQYLVEPTNDLADIRPDSTFASLQVRSTQFSPLESTIDISAIPVGVNSDPDLRVTSKFHMIFFSSITGKVIFPFDSIIGFSKSHPIGVLQLTDMFGNPLLASEDLTIGLTSSRSGAIKTPTITVLEGKSYAKFELTTSSRAEILTITGYADGIRSESYEIESVLAELPGSFVNGGPPSATQPSTITVATDEGTTVLWGVPASFEIVSKDEKASKHDAATSSYLASAQVIAPKPGNYVIDVTLLKDGFEPSRISKTMTFEAYHEPLSVTIFHNEPSIDYGKPVTMSARVLDSDSKPVPGATVTINPGANATANPSVATTDASGMVTFVYTPTGAAEKGMLTATAEKAGYNMGVHTTNFEVENVPTVLPTWLLFGLAGAIAAGVGAASIHHIRKPKVEQQAPRPRAKKSHEDEESDSSD